MRNTKIFWILFFAAVISVHVSGQDKPNVILILTDDQGWGDLRLHGNPWLETPQLDNLATEGLRFENCYVSPLCAPTRASLLTGRYHLSTGVLSVSNGLEVMDTEETTLAELYKSNGYATGIFGKWHNGQHFPNRPTDQGFDEFLGFCAGHLSNYFDTSLERNDSVVTTSGYITDVLTTAALSFIDRNKNQPFFCYIPYNAPHSPHQVPDKYFKKYKAKGLDNERSAIYGMVENIDDNVGKILRYLKKNRLEEKTIVIFLSDNGPNGNRFNGPLRGIKGSVHEGGVKVPFFIRWPGKIPANKVLKTPIAHIDVFPTLQKLCGLMPVPQRPVHGKDLTTMIRNGEEDKSLSDRPIFTHVNFMKLPPVSDLGGFRMGSYRFVMENTKPGVFDLANDPGETINLADSNRQLTKHYVEQYNQWYASAVEQLDLTRPVVVAEHAVLPAYEAQLSPGIRFKEGHGWAHDWIAVWNNTDDSISWEVNFLKDGTYQVTMEYLCDKKNIGSQLECRIGMYKQAAVITKPSKTVLIKSPDRIKRKEAYEVAQWNSMPLGKFRIAAGKNIVRLKATKVMGDNVAEVRALHIVYAER